VERQEVCYDTINTVCLRSLSLNDIIVAQLYSYEELEMMEDFLEREWFFLFAKRCLPGKMCSS